MQTDFQTYVLGFLFHPDRRTVALIEKAKPAWQAGKLNGIGGKVEYAELPDAAMQREFEEETGVPVINWHRYCFMSGKRWMVHVYRAFDIRILEVETRTSEKVVVISPTRLWLCPHMTNLDWLIPLALDQGTNDEGAPLLVEARY
jgi:8-oxo-dGTP diphosphatase